MKTSSKGRAFITAFEGCKLTAYKCPAGILTIGIGHTSKAGPPKVVASMTITRSQAEEIFIRDLQKYEDAVAATLGEVPQHVFDAAVSFHYNTGAIKRASWVKAYKTGDLARAASSLSSTWIRGGGKVLPGLQRRRKAEARLLEYGDYGGVHASKDQDPVAVASVASVQHNMSASSAASVLDVQNFLNELGADLKPDGLKGRRTNRAIKNFQRQHDLKVDGIVGTQTSVALTKAIQVNRLERDINMMDGYVEHDEALRNGQKKVQSTPKTIKELRPHSQTIREADRGTIAGAAAGIGGAAVLIQSLGESITIIKESLADLPPWVLPALIIGCTAYALYSLHRIKKRRLQDAQKGKEVS